MRGLVLYACIKWALACLGAKLFRKVLSIELLQQRAGFHQAKHVAQRGSCLYGDELEQKLVRAAGDVDLIQSAVQVVRLRSEGPRDEHRARAQDEVLHVPGFSQPLASA